MIFTISNDGRKYIIDKRLCINRSKIITARLGVKDLSTNNLYEKKLFENNRLRILTLSHINKVKRLDRIVDVLKEIGDIDISWYHIGYGYKEFESEFKQYAHDNLKHKQNVDFHFLGHLTKKEVLSYLVEQPIDIILNVSDTEGIPVSLMEAASASLPIKLTICSLV
jgi:glycosyltransferase involved in cell wall biosynthesis